MEHKGTDFLLEYIQTFQTCYLCGVCFQNRNHVYLGKKPLCSRCRPRKKIPIFVVRCDVEDEGLRCRYRHQYVIPVQDLSSDIQDSVLSLDGQTLHKTSRFDDVLGIPVTTTAYVDPLHKKFNQEFAKELYEKSYNTHSQEIIRMVHYRLVIHAPTS